MDSVITLELENQGEYLRPQLSVYLACSLSSQENRTFKDEVLSRTAEIFADAGYSVHNPASHTPPGSPHTASEVYLEDMFQTINSDFIFFLRLGRSHGMGIEAQLAADMLVPWAHAHVADDSYNLSPLLAGLANAPGEFCATVTAAYPDEFYLRLADLLRDETRIQRLQAVRHARDCAHSLIHASNFGYRVRVHRLILGLSTSTVGTLTDIDPTWIEAIESDARFVSKLTLVQFARLCVTLEMRFALDLNAPTALIPSPRPQFAIPRALLNAAEDFAEYSLGAQSPSTKRPMDDATLFSQWRSWLGERGTAALEYSVPDLPSTCDPIRVFLCPPISNVLPEEERERDLLTREIRTSLDNSGIAIEIETPNVKKAGRRDLGPTIYLNRVARLRNTDLVVLPLDPPSTGVGIMLQCFTMQQFPVWALQQIGAE